MVNGTKKVVKKLESSDNCYGMEEEPGREETLSQSSKIVPIRTHGLPREDEYPDTWQDIFRQSLEVVVTTGKGVGRLTKAGLSSPLHFSLGIARGFQ
jgi:hypothetical protein